MKRFSLALSLAAAICAPAAHAGKLVVDTVVVVPYGASGSVSSARYAGSSGEYIQCSLRNAASADSQTINYTSIGCDARDAAGRTYGCNTIGTPALRSIVGGLDRSSWIYFWGDGAGNCLGLLTHHASYYFY